MRRIVLPGLVAILAAAACGTAPPTATPPQAGCATGALTIGMIDSQAGLGTVGGYLGFTNHGTADCRLSGWPTLVPVTAAGAPGTAARHAISLMFGPNITAAPVVVLAPGTTAKAAFTGNDNAGACDTSALPTYRQLRVSPPGGTDSVTISAWLPHLNDYLPACAPISVSPVVPATELPPPHP